MIRLKQHDEDIILVEMSEYDMCMIRTALQQRVTHLYGKGLFQSANDCLRLLTDVFDIINALDNEDGSY